MSQDSSGTTTNQYQAAASTANTFYDRLGLTPKATVQEIRRAYREKSKLYHPDTTLLPVAIAQDKFQQLNEAYATLTNPEQRLRYDRQLGYGLPEVTPAQPEKPTSTRMRSVFLDPSDRPLSAGEIFALFLLALTFLCCLLLAIVVGLTRGELALQKITTLTTEIFTEHFHPVAPPTVTKAIAPLPSQPAQPPTFVPKGSIPPAPRAKSPTTLTSTPTQLTKNKPANLKHLEEQKSTPVPSPITPPTRNLEVKFILPEKPVPELPTRLKVKTTNNTLPTSKS